MCEGNLKRRDKKKRLFKLPGGKQHLIQINRLKCISCGKHHTELPDFLTPYKQYTTEVIESVIDGRITPEDLETEDYPCEGTMNHWKWWFLFNRENIEGQVRSGAYTLLDMGTDFLNSSSSLLDELRRRIPKGWLKTVISFIYNTGGRIEPNPA